MWMRLLLILHIGWIEIMIIAHVARMQTLQLFTNRFLQRAATEKPCCQGRPAIQTIQSQNFESN